MRAVIPRRTSLLIDRGVLIVSYATHKQKSLFFFLVQVCAPLLPVQFSLACESQIPLDGSVRLCSDY